MRSPIYAGANMAAAGIRPAQRPISKTSSTTSSPPAQCLIHGALVAAGRLGHLGPLERRALVGAVEEQRPER